MVAPQESLAVDVRNTGNSNLLVKSSIDNGFGEDTAGSVIDRPFKAGEKGTEGVPFVITPPLYVLAGDHGNKMRLNCVECSGLPTDRESLFRLSISAIPSGKATADAVQVALRSSFKLIYRPSGLAGLPDEAYQQLQWQRKGGNVIVRNPTAYYVTLFKMKVNGHMLTVPGMVPPFSSRSQSWCPSGGACSIEWQTLNDLGGSQAAWIVSPDKTARRGKALQHQ